jgi:hypothetical protein
MKEQEATAKGPQYQIGIKNMGTRLQLHLTIEKDTMWVQHEDSQTRIHEANKQDAQRVAKGKKLDLVKGLAPQNG